MADFARGDRLRRLRDGRHLSQEDAAHEIGVSVKTVRSWEKGGGIKWANAKAAGRFYGVDPETLVSRELPADNGGDPLEEIRERLDSIDAALDEQSSRLAELAGVVSSLHTDQQHRRTSPEPVEDDEAAAE